MAHLHDGTIEIQERDLDLLRGLFESRVMTLAHAAVLHFDGRREAAKKRMQKLKAAGIVGERTRGIRDPSTLFLKPRAFDLLHQYGCLKDYPTIGRKALEKRASVSDLTVRHELEVMSVKAALVSAVNSTERFTVAEFSTWPLLHQFVARRSAIDPLQSGTLILKPDGFIRMHEQEPDGGRSEHTFFLEVDRSTEPQETLRRKALCYLDYYKRGGFAERNSAPSEDFRDFPFRVLFVLRTAERRDNTVHQLITGQPSIRTLVWLTTFDELIGDPLGAVWVRPKDASITTHSLFDV